MRILALTLCFLGASLLFAEEQDSLFNLALDAEQAGDVPKTIDLLEAARDCSGPYGSEIREILNSYYAALNMDSSDTNASRFSRLFTARWEGSGLHYQEYGDTSDVKENSGETYLFLGEDVEYHTMSGLTHSWSFSLFSDIFFREKETVFDTSRWAFSPSLDYTLQGDRLALGAGVDFDVSERDGLVPAFSVLGEGDIYQTGDTRAGVYAFLYGNTSGRTRSQLDGYWEHHPARGFWIYAAVGARLEGDSVVCGYRLRDVSSAGHPGEGRSLPDSEVVRYYAGYPTKMGPELRIQSGYKFSARWSVGIRAMLFNGFSFRKDSWIPVDSETEARTYRRQMLQGYWTLRGDWKGETWGFYASVAEHFLRYENLPEDHPEICSFASAWEEFRLGVSFQL